MSALNSATALHRAHRSQLRELGAIVRKDARAAVAPLAIAGVFAAAVFVAWARFLLWKFDLVTWEGGDMELLVLQSLRSASIVCCAVLPAWAGVEVAFLESGFGRRSVLAAAPTLRFRVIGSKFAVALLCAALVAASGAALNAILPVSGVPVGSDILSRPTELFLVATCAALSGLGAPSIGRSRVVGFAAALGLPAAIAGAAWTFGASAWQAAALALATCAILAWVARPALAGEIGCDPARAWRRGPKGIRLGGGGESGVPAGNRRVMTVLLGKDARVVRPLVLFALALVAGFVLFSLALPLFGERVMKDLGIYESDSVVRRLTAAMPIALLAQLAMPAASAFLLAYCDGRAAGRPLCALPASVRAVVGSKVVVCLVVFALFSAISLALFHISEGGEDPLGSPLLSVDGRLWAFLLLCAAGIPWCLALPAFVLDRRRAAIAAVVGVPLLFIGVGLAMQWSILAWHDLVSVRMLGVGSWPGANQVAVASFGTFPPVIVAWTLSGIVAALLAAPAIAGVASTARIRVRVWRAIPAVVVASVAIGSLVYALPGFAWGEYRRRVNWERQARAVMNDHSLDRLVRDVVQRLALVPPTPRRDAAGLPEYNADEVVLARDRIFSEPRDIERLWTFLSWTQLPENRLREDALEDVASGRNDTARSYCTPLEFALAVRASRDPIAAETEIQRLVDDPRTDGAVRIVAAQWLGPVNGAMAAADVLANSPSAMERAFATVVLARCAFWQRWGGWGIQGEFTTKLDPPLKSNAPGFNYCVLRVAALDSLGDLERRAREPAADDGSRGWLGFTSACRIDLATVMRARALLEGGPSDLCEIVQALGNAPDSAYPESPDAVADACECLQRPAH